MTPKQEQFAQLVAHGSSQSDAYRQAYDADGMEDKTIHEAASRLANGSKVAARIAEIQEEIRISLGISKEYITAEILKDIDKIRASGNENNSAQRFMDLAKLHGLITDKKEHSGGVEVKHQALPWEKMYSNGDVKPES